MATRSLSGSTLGGTKYNNLSYATQVGSPTPTLGAGGSGGGGAGGAVNSAGVSAQANTGSGGGGASGSSNIGGTGGSGIVIVRHAVSA